MSDQSQEDKSRADFEAWYEVHSERRRPGTERVFTEDAWRMWIAWQAGATTTYADAYGVGLPPDTQANQSTKHNQNETQT